MELPESVVTIAGRSRFDNLHVTGNQYQGRYGSVYDALAGMDGRHQDISLRLLDCPAEAAEEFSEEIIETVDRFVPVSDHEQLLTVLDYGDTPRPWIATATLSERLSGLQPMDFVSPLSKAISIVEGVVHLHRNDRTHGGLDPRSIVFLDEEFDEVVRASPLIDNAGLFHVFRYHFEASAYLEPAYAAPEYYTTEFGEPDHQTDIYQLGAVLYYLFTGTAPYRGSIDRIRSKVLAGGPPTPSRAGAPAQLDDIITKAMAREKIKRYETVEYLKRDIERVAANRNHEWVDGD